MEMKTNARLKKLVEDLSEREEKVWKDIAWRLSRPRKNFSSINVTRISRYAKDKESIVVPGKVLGNGNIEKKVFVGALSFSCEAEKKITKAGGKCMTIEELVRENPKGSNLRIFR